MGFKEIIVVIGLALSGCAVKLTPDGESVRAFQGAPASECFIVKSVKGESFLGPSAYDRAENARNSLYNETAKSGGNAVQIRNVEESAYGVRIRGDAYRCEAAATLAPVEDISMIKSVSKPADLSGLKSYADFMNPPPKKEIQCETKESHNGNLVTDCTEK